MIFYDVEQGSSDWFDLRRGVMTASRAYKLLTPGGKPSSQMDGLINELIGERLSLIDPKRVETYTNRAIEWGRETEEEARRAYRLESNCDTTNGGFCLTDDRRFGASPDFLVGTDGVGELKCPQAATQVGYVLAGVLPPAYRPQCHMHLIVTGRKWLDFYSYSPGIAPLLLRIEPDEYTTKLRVALEVFDRRFQAALARVRGGAA